ncbi:MAG: glycerol-3-phosphate dehydrogenase/oxidase [Candidatus Eisenbacteria bacterium]|uniref:Glycerol-3-phosphate dehydrogenase/oxidase n=1 Tax=Eiseniibacteriota bacterium TaxID=2212470 RepID=A0A538S6X6_UNCEI|nr:MAG: glycerol-3-phosphate dehydrogenase/oxidase [Candidatus Eisenbacteria bacterium]
MPFDLLVVGGGIQGAAVARDAAMRGLRVLLLERGDLASGTSSRSSKLIHGGIRYLETGQFGLVREALRERAILLRLASEFVRPLPFLIPHYRREGRPRFLVRAGLALYAALAGHHALARHRTLDATEARALEPELRPEGLLGASLYWDAQMDDALLCVSVAVDAERAGATIRTYAAVVGLEVRGSSWRARFHDVDSGEERIEEARCVVNAAGPWAEAIRGLVRAAPGVGLRRTRGTHVVVPSLTREKALLLTAHRDGRAFFVLPWGEHSLIGTTDVDDSTPPERVAPDAGDVRYLLEEAARALPRLRGDARPLRAFAGLRSLAQGSAIRPWANSREHRIVEEGTMLTLIGGKYTTHRSLAERVVDRVAALTGVRVGRCVTAETELPGRLRAIAELTPRYPGKLRLEGSLEITEAEVAHAVQKEHARHPDDILERRSRLWLRLDAMRRAAPQVAAWMGSHLGWDESRRAREVERVAHAMDREAQVLDAAMEGGRT